MAKSIKKIYFPVKTPFFLLSFYLRFIFLCFFGYINNVFFQSRGDSHSSLNLEHCIPVSNAEDTVFIKYR